MTLFLELFLMLALYYMYSIQTQMIRLVENQMNHLHELNRLLAGDVECGDDDDYDEDCECEDCECEDCDDCDDCDDNKEDGECTKDVNCEQVYEDDGQVNYSDKEEDGEVGGDKDDDNCATCNRSDEKCRCPNPFKLLSKKTQ
jgi:hypothetical protein